MSKITLSQLLQYYDKIEAPNRIQIVTGNNDWDFADELTVNSKLLEPFGDSNITNMSCEKSFQDGSPVIRISLEI